MELIAEFSFEEDSISLKNQYLTGFVFATSKGNAINTMAMAKAMRTICSQLKAEQITPHDLRRSHGTMIARLGFGKDALNRIQNHKEGGIASVYDRHQYSDENKRVMEAVANKIMGLVTGSEANNVIQGGFRKIK
jgi:integrase